MSVPLWRPMAARCAMTRIGAAFAISLAFGLTQQAISEQQPRLHVVTHHLLFHLV